MRQIIVVDGSQFTTQILKTENLEVRKGGLPPLTFDTFPVRAQDETILT